LIWKPATKRRAGCCESHDPPVVSPVSHLGPRGLRDRSRHRVSVADPFPRSEPTPAGPGARTDTGPGPALPLARIPVTGRDRIATPARRRATLTLVHPVPLFPRIPWPLE